MMNIGWRKGELPSEWKTAIVKFLRKPGKSTYYSTSSYRPISLTCIMCKLMERVILERLVAYIEGNNGTLWQAYLISNSSPKKSPSMDLAVLPERKLLIHLQILPLIRLIRKKATEDIETIVELTRKWRININMEMCEVCICAKKDLDQHQKELVVNNYSFKYNFFVWILAISLTAISSILRSTGSMLPSTSIASLPDVAGNPKHIDNPFFKYNPTPRLLGIILDEKIKFDNHIMHVERKANNSIHIIREIKGLAVVLLVQQSFLSGSWQFLLLLFLPFLGQLVVCCLLLPLCREKSQQFHPYNKRNKRFGKHLKNEATKNIQQSG
jgi:hypothetical protein